MYGEVYLIKNEDDPQNPIVMKVIPIEGLEYVNGERQKQFKEILSEITIAKYVNSARRSLTYHNYITLINKTLDFRELSELRNNELSNTPSFNKVYDVRCVQGTYPKKLKESWEDYDELKGSENDYPDFCENQLYIVLELENGGKDIEAFEFWNAKQSYALFFQVNQLTFIISVLVFPILLFLDVFFAVVFFFIFLADG